MTSPQRMTVDSFRALVAKAGSGQKKNKYNARKVDGHDSGRENARARQLKLKLKAGLISNLREQVVYTLIPSQKNEEGITERPVRYKADFVYVDKATGKTIVEDSKGFRTPDYIIKRKLMLFIHGITIKET